jgi:ribonuclease Z
LRRFLVPLLVLAILVAMASVFLRGPIALRIMQAALERNMTLDPIAELDDGLHAILCGAGGPLPDPDRSGPCVAIVAGEDVYVVDAGSGAARRLARLGILPSRVEAVLLTHFHSDHIDGLGELGVLRWTAGSHVEPLPVHGPEGVRKVTEGLDQAYRLDAIYRTAHHGPEVTPPTGSGLRAMAFAQPPDGDDHAGRSIVVSGDTKKSANLERFARGVDLLIHEALSPELMGVIQHAAENVGNRSMAAIAQDVLDYHTSPVEAAESAEAVGAGHLLYYHIVPPMPIPGLASVFLDGVSQAYRGGVTLGRDGTMISLPAASEEIRVVQR